MGGERIKNDKSNPQWRRVNLIEIGIRDKHDYDECLDLWIELWTTWEIMEIEYDEN